MGYGGEGTVIEENEEIRKIKVDSAGHGHPKISQSPRRSAELESWWCRGRNRGRREGFGGERGGRDEVDVRWSGEIL